MSTKVKGITIELSADVSGIESALKNVNKDAAATARELSSVNKSLKLNPQSVELLEQKQRLLATAIDQTTSKLSALKSAQAAVSQGMASGTNTQSQYDALTREISDTTNKLATLKSEQAATGAAFAQASGGVSAFQNGLTAVGNAAANVGAQTAGLSMAAGAAVGGLLALGLSAANDADELLTLAQQTGMSAERLQELKYASEGIDVPVETINTALTAMKRNLGRNEAAWKAIGVEVRKQSGEYKSIEQIFDETVGALGRINDETKRDIASMNIFGRSANELAGIIDDGGEKMRALGKAAHENGAIIPEEDLQKLASFNDKLGQMKMEVSVAGAEAAIPILEALEPIINVVAAAMRNFANVLQVLPQPVVTFATGVLLLIAALSPVAMVIAGVCSALNMLTTTLPMVGVAIGQLVNNASAAIAANPYVGVIIAIIAALALLVMAIVQVVSHLDEIKEVGSQAFAGIKSAVAPAANSISKIKDAAKSALSKIPDYVGQAVQGLSKLKEGAKEAIDGFKQAFSGLIGTVSGIGKQIMESFAEGISSAIGIVTSAVQELADAVDRVLGRTSVSAGMAGAQAGQSYASSFNSSASQITTPTVSSVGSAGRTMMSAPSGMSSDTVSSAGSSSGQATPVNVTVELVGSAKNIFETVRVENNTLATATGYHALA